MKASARKNTHRRNETPVRAKSVEASRLSGSSARMTSQNGFSLIELMIALTIGLIIIAGVSNMFGGVIRGDRDMLASMRLNSDLSTAMALVTTELRRAGYGPEVDWGLSGTNSMINLVDENSDGVADCILFSYDRDDSGTIESTERNGFKLEGGTLRMREWCNADPTDAAQVADCSSICNTTTAPLDQWQDMMDPGDITITEFTMNTEGSRCLHNGTQSYWYMKDDTESVNFPCRQWFVDSEDATDLAIYYPADLDDPGAGYQSESTSFDVDLTGSDGSAANLSDGMWTNTSTDTDAADRPSSESDFNGTIEARRVNISITGEIGAGDGVYTKTLTSSVKVRNEQVITGCPSDPGPITDDCDPNT